MERIRNIILGPRYAVRLEDLGPYDRFQAVCLVCGKRNVIHPDLIRRHWPGYTLVMDLERKLKCKGCGNTASNVLEIGRVVRD